MKGSHTPFVSVVIPFYSNKAWLQEALDSISCQSYKNIEVIIVNDGSKEDLDDIHFRGNEIKVYSQENKGAGAARNVGILNANGEYIAFLDSDDLWHPDKLEIQLDFMMKNSIICSHTDYLRFWENNKSKYVSTKFMGDVFLKSFAWIPIATPCVIIKREFLIQNQLFFREGKDIGEDSYLWQNIAKLTDWGYLPIPLANVRMRGTNSAFNYMLQLKYRAGLLDMLRENKDRFPSKILYSWFVLLSKYCLISYSILSRISGNKKLSQILAAILYTYPYLNYKVIKSIL